MQGTYADVRRGLHGLAMPSAEAWAGRLRLKRVGREHVGPCPVCGGSDRFHVRDGPNGRTAWGCRGCIDGQPTDAKRRATAAVMRATWGRGGGPATATPRPPRGPRRRSRTGIAAALWRRTIPVGDSPAHPARLWLAGTGGHGPLWRPYVPLPPTVRWQQGNAGGGALVAGLWPLGDTRQVQLRGVHVVTVAADG